MDDRTLIALTDRLERLIAAVARLAPAEMPDPDFDAADCFVWSPEPGSLEPVDSPLALPKTELCLYAGYGQVMEPRTRGARSFTHSYGAGDIVLTTKRLIFNGGATNIAVQLKSVVSQVTPISREIRPILASRS